MHCEIIALGTSFDTDQTGPLLAERLAATDLATRYPGIEFHITPRALPAHLPSLLGSHAFAILLDALEGEYAAGRVMEIEAEMLAETGRSGSCHGFSLDEALKLLLATGDMPKRLHILGIGTGGTLRPKSAENCAALALPGVLEYLDSTLSPRQTFHN